MEVDNMAISESIYALRNSLGLTQEQFAKKVGVSQSAINYWENGKRQPRLEQLKKISDILNIPLNEILSFEDATDIWRKEKDEIRLNKPALVDTIQVGESLVINDITEIKLISDYRQLNENGQIEALKRVQELTEISRYTEPYTSTSKSFVSADTDPDDE